MKCKAILLDLDGTLIKTPLSYITKTVNKVLNDMGVPPVSQEEASKFWFSPDVDKFIGNIVKNPSLFWQLFRQYDNPSSRLHVSRVYEDSFSLEELQNNKIDLGIVTSTPKDVAEKEIFMLNRLKLKSVIYAQPIYGVKSKPDPESIHLSLKRLGVSAEQTIYVGNGIEDIITARNAGVTDIFLERSDYPYHLDLEPTKRILSLTELKEFVL